MIAKRVALTSIFWIIASAIIVLVTSIILIQKNKTNTQTVINKILERENYLVDAIANQNTFAYKFETAWIEKTLSNSENFSKMELKFQDKKIISITGDLTESSWPITEYQEGNKLGYKISFTNLGPADFIFLLKILMILLIGGIFILILIAIANGRDSREKANHSPPTHAEVIQTKPVENMQTTPERSPSPAPRDFEKTVPKVVSPIKENSINSDEKEFLYRLDKELSRAAENAIDLSLFIIQSTSDQIDDGYDLAIEEFVHEDLIYRLPKNHIAIILPHLDLDQTMIRAELFLKKGKNKNIDYFMEASAGISSRNGRLIDSKRIVKETHTAIDKANTKEGRLVGFRADPARYRSFLTHQKI